MKKFICPRCKGYLNVGRYIVLSASNRDNKGIVLFSPEIGNYTTETNPEFNIQEGEKYDFLCPICKEKLASNIHDNLSRIIMVDENNKEYEILFSKIAGEKSTYKVVGESVEIYGDHKTNYLNFVNLSFTK